MAEAKRVGIERARASDVFADDGDLPDPGVMKIRHGEIVPPAGSIRQGRASCRES